VGPTQVRDHCPVDETGRHTEGAGCGHAAANGRAMNLSALKLARPIADLAGSERIQPAHIAEAIHLRSAETDGVAPR
jgi:magnesium chelatase family protein